MRLRRLQWRRGDDNQGGSTLMGTSRGDIAPTAGARGRRPAVVNKMIDDLVSDIALKSADEDRLDHAAIVTVAADLILASEPPVNIALFGSWGSGKSSFIASLSDVLQQRSKHVRVARYDAWKYGGRALKLSFIESLADDLGVVTDDFGSGLRTDQESSHVKMKKYLAENHKALSLGVLLAVVIATVWFFAIAGTAWVIDRPAGFGAAADIAVAGVGSVLSLALIALLIGPKVMESAVVKVITPAPQTDDQFASRFRQLVEKVTDKRKKKLVVFVDELDRCRPEDVVATLVDLKTFLEVPGCIFVVAADREVLEAALGKVPQITPIREEDPYYSTPGAFLDKIFQHQLALPPLRPQALTKFARDLVTQQGGIWAELRGAERNDRLFLEVIYLLVPVHVRSPRRVKVLLNHYAMTARTAQSRGIDWLPRASEIAMFTVLQVEFPRLAADLATAPMLLAYLRGLPVPTGADKLESMVSRYLSRDAAVPAEPAGALLESEETDDQAARESANKVLNAQLRSYLAKAAAQGIDDPRPDLSYMQSAGSQHGIADPEVGYVIDVAADLSPDEVIDALAGQPTMVLTAAAHLLAQQAEDELGPGRAAIVESLCRVLESLDYGELGQVAELVEPIVRTVTAEGNLREGAIPGAFTLGVVTGRTDLVDELVARYSADDFATKGLLTRLGPVLVSAGDRQAATVRHLLLAAYRAHPEPMHDLLRTLPLDIAWNLWASSKDRISDLLEEMPDDSVAPTARTTLASRTSTTDLPAPDAAIRWGQLLDSVEARTDHAEALISGVLMMGQLHSKSSVQALVYDREDDAIERILNPELRTEHALVAMIHAPLGHCSWWTKYATSPTADETLAKAAVVRLLGSLAEAPASVAPKIAGAVVKVLGFLDDAGTEAAADSLADSLSAMEWTPDANVKERRTAAYAVGMALLGGDQAKRMRGTLVGDLVEAFDSHFTPETVSEGLQRVQLFDRDTAVEVDAAFAERKISGEELVATVRVRLAARLVAGLPALPVELMEEVVPLAGTKHSIVTLWTKLQPPVNDYLRVQKLRGAAVDELSRYAQRLTVADRTTLWIAQASRDATHLTAVGAHGVAETAFASIAALLVTATAHGDRAALVSRALTARAADAAASRALADLALALLENDVRRDGPLAASLAIHLGDAAHGRVGRLREAFDAEVARPNHRLTQRQIIDLRNLRLLSKEKAVVARVVNSVRRQKKRR